MNINVFFNILEIVFFIFSVPLFIYSLKRYISQNISMFTFLGFSKSLAISITTYIIISISKLSVIDLTILYFTYIVLQLYSFNYIVFDGVLNINNKLNKNINKLYLSILIKTILLTLLLTLILVIKYNFSLLLKVYDINIYILIISILICFSIVLEIRKISKLKSELKNSSFIIGTSLYISIIIIICISNLIMFISNDIIHYKILMSFTIYFNFFHIIICMAHIIKSTKINLFKHVSNILDSLLYDKKVIDNDFNEILKKDSTKIIFNDFLSSVLIRRCGYNKIIKYCVKKNFPESGILKIKNFLKLNLMRRKYDFCYLPRFIIFIITFRKVEDKRRLHYHNFKKLFKIF